MSSQPSRWEKLIPKVLSYARRTLTVVLVVVVGVLFTFLFTRGLSYESFSERMFWASVFFTLLAGLVTIGASGARRSFGIPRVISKPEHAKQLLEKMPEIQDKIEERYDAAIQVFLIGLICLAISALAQTIGAWLN